jgi:hypothetical protein
VDGVNISSAFVCIQPGTEFSATTGDASAYKIGCCCLCESYRITGDTTYGTSLLGVDYCGSDTAPIDLTLTPGKIITICTQQQSLFLALVNGTGPGGTLILPMVEFLGCCNSEPIL